MIPNDPMNVIICGVGGQGNVLASLILGRYFVDQGMKVTIGETYGVSQRGGAVMSQLRISKTRQPAPLMPSSRADLIVALEPVEGLRMLGQFGNPTVTVLSNTRPWLPMSVLAGEHEYPEVSLVLDRMGRFSEALWKVDATEIALGLGSAILANIVMLGALQASVLLPLEETAMRRTLEASLPPKRLEQNLQAFSQGQEAVKRH
ncbi:putative indolepyruvate ferredoxin oxidoreductase, beta subunit [delta proteobacterium NaphS2]|nr:putative indolepyruvate ferredoxin oxidoreductase, beta subunit [delta proteobacterium NaphS2]